MPAGVVTALRWLADLVLAPLAYLAVAWRLLPDLFRPGGATVAQVDLAAGDYQGTLWFYAWLRRASTEGLPLLWSDLVCAPRGEALAGNFPNRIDAWLAQPFFAAWPMPDAYDRFVGCLPVLSALGGYVALRVWTRNPVVAWVGGLFYGFSAYLMDEVYAGRPVTALLAIPPLFLAGWWRLFRAGPGLAGWAWAVACGALAALVAWWYVPFAGFLFPLALATFLAALVAPVTGEGEAKVSIGRARGIQVGRLAVAVVVSLGLTAPYAHEQLVQRRAWIHPRSEPPALLTSPRWDPYIYRDFYRLSQGEELHPPPGGRSRARSDAPVQRTELDVSPYWSRVQVESMPWDYLWNPRPDDSPRTGFVAPTLLAAGLLGGLLGGRRGWAWILVGVSFWLLTLGPNATARIDGEVTELLLVDGARLSLPVRYLLDLVPGLDAWLRPQRMFPLVLLALAGGLVAGLEQLARLRPPWTPFVATALALVIGARALSETAALPRFSFELREWRVPAALQRVADTEGDFAIAELPAGIGHMTAAWGAWHGKRRSEPVHELLAAMREGPPPAECYGLPFLRALWYLGHPGAEAGAAVEAGLTDTSLAEARAAGFRYLLVYPRLYTQAARDGHPRNLAEVRRRLEERLGPPVVDDEEGVLYALTP